MLGAMSSDEAKVIHNFAHANKLPLVTYSSSSPELSNTAMYPNLMRTVPPDGPLMKVHSCYC